jgi:hypothetical protein
MAMARAKQVQQDEPTYTVPLFLAPLLAPYRKHGRLSLRVERMPQQARLSRGSRTGEGSWSVALDELDDLSFSAPASLRKVHTLALRVASLANGNTLATIEFKADPDATAEPAHAAISPEEAANFNILRQELEAAKNALAARDAELAERLAAAAAEAAAQFQQTLAKAEAAWTETEKARLAAVQKQWQEQFAEAIVDVEEEQTRLRNDDVSALQAKLEDVQAVLAEREAALKRAQDAHSDAHSEGNTATAAALARVQELETALAEREAELSRAASAAEDLKAKSAAALLKAEQAWKHGEAERLAEAETRWREASAQALSEAQADADTLRSQGAADNADILEHMTQLQAAVSERDAALERAQAAADKAREEAEARLAKAHADWKAGEDARMAAAETSWQSKIAKLEAAAARAQTTAAPAAKAASDSELRALREKLAAVQTKLDLREAAVGRAATLANEERLRWQKEAQDAIVKAGRERKAAEAARLAEAHAEWSRDAARDFAIATARAEAAEAALAQVRVRTKNDTQLHTELAALRSALAVRESQLAELRGEHTADPEAQVEDQANAAKMKRSKTMVRDGLVAVALGVVAVMAWPQVSGLISSPPPAPPKTVVPVVAEPVQPKLLQAVLIKPAKLRAKAGDAKVLTKLAADTRVEILNRKGDWTQVRLIVPEKGQPAEGWVRASMLKLSAAE